MLLHHRPRKKTTLIIGMLLLGVLAAFMVLLPPTQLWTLIIFFVLFTLAIFFICAFTFNQVFRALLISIGLTVYMILRSLELRHWLYPLLIIAIIVSIEVYRISQNSPPKRSHDIPKL